MRYKRFPNGKLDLTPDGEIQFTPTLCDVENFPAPDREWAFMEDDDLSLAGQYCVPDGDKVSLYLVHKEIVLVLRQLKATGEWERIGQAKEPWEYPHPGRRIDLWLKRSTVRSFRIV